MLQYSRVSTMEIKLITVQRRIDLPGLTEPILPGDYKLGSVLN